MTDTETAAAVIDPEARETREAPAQPAAPAEEPPAPAPKPQKSAPSLAAPSPAEARVESLLRRLEEQSALQTKLAKKRLFWGRLSALCVGVMAAVLVFTVNTLMPRVESVLGTANSTLSSITILSQQLQDADIPAILENLDQTLTEGRASLNEASQAVQSVATIDFASLNQAILDLQRLLSNPLGSLFGRG